jgi:hypothetical protein
MWSTRHGEQRRKKEVDEERLSLVWQKDCIHNEEGYEIQLLQLRVVVVPYHRRGHPQSVREERPMFL